MASAGGDALPSPPEGRPDDPLTPSNGSYTRRLGGLYFSNSGIHNFQRYVMTQF
jgi:hypothetical protein